MDKSTLPNLPSELITLALEDLVSCENDAGYTIDMTEWHKPTQMAECLVCFAGAVMAQTLQADISFIYTPSMMMSESAKLNSLDSFRQGCVAEGLEYFGYSDVFLEDINLDRVICEYRLSPAQFRADMVGLVKDLQNLDL